MGLFGILIGVKEDGMEAKELAAKTGADSLLISKYPVPLNLRSYRTNSCQFAS